MDAGSGEGGRERTSFASLGVHERREHGGSLIRLGLCLSLLSLLILGAMGHPSLATPELREPLLFDGFKRRILLFF